MTPGKETKKKRDKITVEHFINMLKENMDNRNLTDADLRSFIERTLKLIAF